MLQLFRGKVGELNFGHLRVTCPQLIFDLDDRRDVARGQLLRVACWRRRRGHTRGCRNLLLVVCLCALGVRRTIRSLKVTMLLRVLLRCLLSLRRLLLVLCLERSKERLVICKLL